MDARLSYRMVIISGVPAGLLGLTELLTRLYAEGMLPDDPRLKERLIAGVRQHNYIPRAALSDYQEALCREYELFCARQQNGAGQQLTDYGTWRGYPREHIPWFPTVASELCTACDHCLSFCNYGVYTKMPDGKVTVVEPFLCRVGCSSCAAVCEPNAIMFPPRGMLDDYRPIG